MTAGLDCWTSWTWPSLTSSWVSWHVWHNTNNNNKRFSCFRGRFLKVMLIHLNSVIIQGVTVLWCTAQKWAKLKHTYVHTHIYFILPLFHSWLSCLLVFRHREHGSPPLWDIWKVWKRDLYHPSGQRQRVGHCILQKLLLPAGSAGMYWCVLVHKNNNKRENYHIKIRHKNTAENEW